MRRTNQNDKTLLPLPLVPFQRSLNRPKPIRRLLIGANRRERVGRSCHFDVISLCEDPRFISERAVEDETLYSRRSSTLPRPSKEAQAVLLEL